jgi:hypothetical protein
MKTRFTIKELTKPESPEYISNDLLINILINERMNGLNMNSPLYNRLKELKSQLPELLKKTPQ